MPGPDISASACINSSNIHNNLISRHKYPHFTDENTETQYGRYTSQIASYGSSLLESRPVCYPLFF